MDLQAKKDKLETVIKKYKSMVVAFSGGVDSTLLLAVAHDLLGNNVLAVTGLSPIHLQAETEKGAAFAKKRGIPHIMHKTREMELPEFLDNNKNRCYFCKKLLISDLLEIAAENGIGTIAHGANIDDLDDYRPGFKAAEEMGVISPLIEAGLSKSDIRILSKEMGLETWNKPAHPCFATRLPYGTTISREIIDKIAAAEKILSDMGLDIFRVRHHGDIARIEVPPEYFQTIFKDGNRQKILDGFKEIGYLYISLDLEGYTPGSLNRSLS